MYFLVELKSCILCKKKIRNNDNNDDDNNNNHKNIKVI